MSGLSCPVCALHIGPAAAQAEPEIEHCPRCLARTGGTLSVKLVPATAAGRSSSWNSRAAHLLRQLRPPLGKR